MGFPCSAPASESGALGSLRTGLEYAAVLSVTRSPLPLWAHSPQHSWPLVWFEHQLCAWSWVGAGMYGPASEALTVQWPSVCFV